MAGKVQHNNHYVSEQGHEALKLVDQWLTHWMPIDEKKRQKLYIISPFKSVVRDFKIAGYSFFRGQRDKLEEFRKWANVCVGTVHTFQGKEAEEVIILLGCDQSKVSSAKWVNANMLNVAVTRAKCRVYFIGDWEVWKQNEVFANNVVFQPKESAGEPLVRVNDLALLQPTDHELPLLTEEQDLVEEGSEGVADSAEVVTLLDSANPTDKEFPLISEEQYLADIGLDKYLHLCLLQLSEKDPGKLYVMDMKRRWFYQFSYDNTAIAILDGSRASWFDDTLHKCRIQCTLVYPLKIAEEDKSYIKTGIHEAIQFVQTYLTNQQKDMERYLQRHHSGH